MDQTSFPALEGQEKMSADFVILSPKHQFSISAQLFIKLI